MKSKNPFYSGVKDKHGRKIKVGDTIKDGHDTVGKVVENTHPWGFKRLQYQGLSIINHPDKNWYEIVKE